MMLFDEAGDHPLWMSAHEPRSPAFAEMIENMERVEVLERKRQRGLLWDGMKAMLKQDTIWLGEFPTYYRGQPLGAYTQWSKHDGK